MNRRGFLQACLAAATAPYVVTTSGVLMPVRKIVTLEQVTDVASIIAGQRVFLMGSEKLCRWFSADAVEQAKKAGWRVLASSQDRSSMEAFEVANGLKF